MRVQVNGDLSVGSSDTLAENVNSNSYVKISHLETTKTGAISSQSGLSYDSATLNSKMIRNHSIGENASNKISIGDSVETQGALTIARQTTITSGPTSNVYSKTEVDQTFS